MYNDSTFLNKFDDVGIKLNKTENKIKNYIKENYKKVSFLDLEDFSLILSVKIEDINKYIIKLGYKDFESLRDSIRNFAMSDLSSTDRYEFSQITLNPQINNIKNAIIGKEISNLNKLLDSFDETNFYRLLEEIIKAPEVVVIGTRSSAIIATYFAQMLERLGKRSHAITSGGSKSIDGFGILDKNALVVGIGFARYPKETIKLLSFFKKQCFKISSITDNDHSALIPFSDIYIQVPCDSVSITDFYATPFCVINMIVTLLSQIDKVTALSCLCKFEQAAKDYEFYF